MPSESTDLETQGKTPSLDDQRVLPFVFLTSLKVIFSYNGLFDNKYGLSNLLHLYIIVGDQKLQICFPDKIIHHSFLVVWKLYFLVSPISLFPFAQNRSMQQAVAVEVDLLTFHVNESENL